MVEPVDTAKVKTEEGGEEKRFSSFKKKNQGRNANATAKQADRDVPELLGCVEFSMDRNGPDLYIKAVEKLQLYTSTTYKNGADMCKSIKQEKTVTFVPPELDENATSTQREMWNIRANNTIKREELLEANLEAMYEVTMSICDPVLKDQVCNNKLYEDIDERQDTLALRKIIKKTMYSNRDDDTHMGYNHVIAMSNYYWVQQERFQSLQDYRDQFVAYRKVCEQLGSKVGESEDGATNVLKKENIVNPTQQQKDEAAKKAVEEHHAIQFILGADKYKYGKLLKDMKNDVILKKDPFPKTVAEACHVLSKWPNSYGKYSSGKVDSNDGIAFTTVTDEKEANKNEKKKGITCFKCKKKGHYSNECTKELPVTSEKVLTS